jgi:hypothetical protein
MSIFFAKKCKNGAAKRGYHFSGSAKCGIS